MSRKYNFRAKAYFLAGLILMITAGAVWMINGGVGRLMSSRADENSATSSLAGNFSETWTASEMYGFVRYRWQDATGNGTYDGTNVTAWIATTVPRKDTNVWSTAGIPCTGTTANPYCFVANGRNGYVPSLGASYWTTWRDVHHKQNAIGVLSIDGSTGMPVVTKWTVNGHMH